MSGLKATPGAMRIETGPQTAVLGVPEQVRERRWFSALVPESDAMLHFDMLRFVAATGVVWHHSHEFLVPAGGRAALLERTQALALFVDLFFVISGYVIAFVYAGRLRSGTDYARFLQRRVGRLVPLHWLTLTVSFILWTAIARGGYPANHMPDRSPACVANAALLLNGLFTCGNGNVLNGITWSISAEMALYVLFPLLLAVWRARAILPLALVAMGAALLASRNGRWDEVAPLLRALPSFAFGMVLFRWRDRLPVVRSSWPVLVLTALLLASMMTGVSQYVVLAEVYMLAVLGVATDQSRTAVPLVRLGAGLGKLTYGIYMWHILFTIVLLNAIGDKMLELRGATMLALIVLCYLLVVMWSVVSLRWFETPVRRWIDRL